MADPGISHTVLVRAAGPEGMFEEARPRVEIEIPEDSGNDHVVLAAITITFGAGLAVLAALIFLLEFVDLWRRRRRRRVA